MVLTVAVVILVRDQTQRVVVPALDTTPTQA